MKSLRPRPGGAPARPSPPVNPPLPPVFWWLWTVTLVNRCGGFVAPFLALYLTSDRGHSTSYVGLVVSLYGLGAMGADLLGGQSADRIGRRPTLLWGNLAAAVCTVALGLADGSVPIAVLTFMVGLTGNLARPAVAALLADTVPEASRARAFALNYWAINIGFALSAVVAGAMARHGYLALFVGDAATTAACAAVVWYRIPESRPGAARPAVGADKSDGGGGYSGAEPGEPAERADPAERAGRAGPAQPAEPAEPAAPVGRSDRTPVRGRGGRGVFAVLVALTVLLYLVYQQATSTLPLTMNRAGFSAQQYGWVIGVNGAVIVLLQLPLTRWFGGRDRAVLLAVGALLTGGGFALAGVAGTVVVYAATVAVWTVGEILCAPAAMALATELSPPQARGRYLGLYTLSFSTAAFAGPALGSLVLGRAGATVLWTGCGAAGVVTALGYFLLDRRTRSRARTRTGPAHVSPSPQPSPPSPRSPRSPQSPPRPTTGSEPKMPPAANDVIPAARPDPTGEPQRAPALLILTDLAAVARHMGLVEEARRRHLAPLLVFGPATPPDELAHHRRAGHPAAAAPDAAHIDDYGVDATLAALGPLLDRYALRGVLACGESFVETAGVLAERFGLPGPGAEAARICRDKNRQRRAAPFLAPRWTELTADTAPDEEFWHTFPAVLKPTGRMCSSGVQHIADLSALRRHLPDYPADEALLLEERISGPEFSVESLVHEGRIVWAGITAKRTNEHDTRFFTETGHMSPAADLDPRDERALLSANTDLLAAVGFGSGITHAEYRLAGDRVVLMEIAARLPGDAITRLWHLALGTPLEPAVVDLALGRRPTVGRPVRRAEQLYLDHTHGVLGDVEAPGVPVSWVEDDANWPSVQPAGPDAAARTCAVVVTRRRGDLLGEATDSMGRSVSVVTDAPLPEDLAEFTQRAAKSVTITTDTPHG
ncbi:MFS transporter [Streptomyces sp. NBC_01190]|uniref:MFS transporter n=1 Tax=Streptomyces sp. NBC_01190 TaxID=2903767 RepID=UPI00386ADA9C|nr:MFS transporter [Streptomyces sp. NBC_01190]